MNNTKENILHTALCMFASDGYTAVSVSAIAGQLGMTKGALYRHYKDKRDILDSIVKRMFELDTEHARKHMVPEKTFDIRPDDYCRTSVESIRTFIADQFEFWTEDEFGRDFRKLLTLEQYRDPEMADLYEKCLTSGPISYMEDLFREMMDQGIWLRKDPKQMALEFYAPFYLFVSLSDTEYGYEETANMLAAHVERFIAANIVASRQEDTEQTGDTDNGDTDK